MYSEALYWKTGFCGGLTTFSLFSWHTFYLMMEGYVVAAILLPVLTLSLGIPAFRLGAKAASKRQGSRSDP